ncbi:MAG: transglycosylase SLT domain-containing protein [Thermoanaerobaculales bacterium]|jgi:soluble lytic murein transglycosylase|nr:transglycosylase SLT domain-containing protein [Thermoanaerobaculales bacterium]
MTGLALLLAAGAQAASPGEVLGLEALALAGRWDQVLLAASQRRDQLPLRAGEALVAAHAAGLAGDLPARTRYLELAIDDPELGAAARVELAELVVVADPSRALELVVGLLVSAPSSQLRDAALDLAERAASAGLPTAQRSLVEAALPTLSRSSRRGLELALARTAEPPDRARLSRLLAVSTDDLPALDAALELEAGGEPDPVDRWRIAQTYFRHGLYDRAAPVLERLYAEPSSQTPRGEVAFLRGRCAFRRGDWAEAAAWYGSAISSTPADERRAELEVHLGRTHELAGDLASAVAAAQRAVRLRPSDDRRLFLARLRLRRGEPGLAQAGLAQLRSRGGQARGELMLGLDELDAGRAESGRRRLAQVSRDPWRGMASVLAAEAAVAADEPATALEILVAGSAALDSYWAGEARRVMAAIDPGLVERWRRLEAEALADPAERVSRRALLRSLLLEPDEPRLVELRQRAAVVAGLDGEPEEPAFPPGLAARFWAIGLESAAVRWDPSGLPRGSARATWWTAQTELALGRPWLAISAADAVRRQAIPGLSARGLPSGLRRAYYPLPFDAEVRAAGARHGLPWALLAGVAREESRWNPSVLSSVGARGLMQIMPATATAIGRAQGRPDIDPDDLFEPLIALDLGAAELGRLLEAFDGNRAAAVAAYNAGEAQARLWLAQCGGACSEARYLAGVSFEVTREYTEEVLASAVAYEGLYGSPSSRVSARTE